LGQPLAEVGAVPAQFGDADVPALIPQQNPLLEQRRQALPVALGGVRRRLVKREGLGVLRRWSRHGPSAGCGPRGPKGTARKAALGAGEGLTRRGERRRLVTG